MREVKFRAWDREEQRMQMDIQRCHDGLGKEGHTEDWFGAYFGEGSLFPDEQTARYAVMQFTGLHDKDGYEIYEGDILEHPEFSDPIIVEWDEENAGFVSCGAVSEWTTCKVTGNIYENLFLVGEGYE